MRKINKRDFLKYGAAIIGGSLVWLYLGRPFDRISKTIDWYIQKNPYSDEYLDFVLSQRETVNYIKIMGNDRAVYFGENHSHLAPKDEIAEHIHEFSNLGFTHYGMEFLDSDFQPTLDKYFDTGEGSEEILLYLAKMCSFSGYITESSRKFGEKYMQSVEVARENGLRILGLDLPRYKKKEMSNDINKAEEEGDVKRRNELKQILNDERENCMSSIVSNVLKNPRTKFLTFTGDYHNNNISDIVKEKSGIKGVSVSFTGSKFWESVNLFDQAALVAGLGNKEFMVKVTPEWINKLDSNDPRLRDDYIIHLSRELP